MCYLTPDYETLEEVRERVRQVAPHLTHYDDMEPANIFKLAEKLARAKVSVLLSLMWFIHPLHKQIIVLF